MGDILVSEAITGVFLFLPLLRPLFKRMWPLDGLVWLPPLALGVSFGLFPAYGFRPECIPLLLYCIVFNAVNAPAIASLVSRFRNGAFRERKRALNLAGMILLAAVMFPAIYFRPRVETAFLTEGVRSFTITDESRGEDLFVRLYGGETAVAGKARPLLLLIPPALGSLDVTDRLCGELEDKGFVVLAYSRPNFDAPARNSEGRRFALSNGKRYRLFRAVTEGLVSESANSDGRALEEGRRQDLAFLLDALMPGGELHYALPAGTAGDCVFIAGYGAGGAAALLFTSTAGFVYRYPSVKGLIAVESPIMSALAGRERPPPEPLRLEGWFRSLIPAIRARAAELGRHRISRMTDLPKPGVPVLFLLSDRVMNPRYREARYGTIIASLEGMEQPAILAAADGAGPLDYSDIPVKYPICRFLFPGRRRSAPGEEAPGTAALMANFAAAVLEAGGTEAAVPERRIFPPESILIESKTAAFVFP